MTLTTHSPRLRAVLTSAAIGLSLAASLAGGPATASAEGPLGSTADTGTGLAPVEIAADGGPAVAFMRSGRHWCC